MRVAAVAAVVAAAAGVAAAATECSSILPFAASCDIEDGLLIVSPDPGSILAANCRGYCTASPVSIRLRPCAFCTAERCQTGYDVRGHPMVCCDEDACTAACEKPPENCRWNGDCTEWICGRTIGASPPSEGGSPLPAATTPPPAAPAPTPAPIGTPPPGIDPPPTDGAGGVPIPTAPPIGSSTTPSPTPSVGNEDDGGGFPVWAGPVIGLVGAIGAAFIGVCVKQRSGSCGQGLHVHFNRQSVRSGGVAING